MNEPVMSSDQAMKKPGRVILIGAGPGDPGLLTVKAAELLRQADVVVHDRLVGQGILDLVPSSAERIDVGKQAGNHPVPQDGINQILVDQALAGRTVIRLKGGDSFVFGRGGEELEALAAHAIPFEVVPGITSALAAPAYAGIPVTHRDYCSSVHIITGHQSKDKPLTLDFEALVRLDGTLVFLMSLATVGEIMTGLIAGGLSPDMPAAVIEQGTRPQQRKLVATVGTLSKKVAELGFASPALMVVGRVCSLSDTMDWFSRLPLKGLRILVTRPKSQSAGFIGQLSALGAEAVPIPAIETRALPFDLPRLEEYGTLVLTSINGVRAFMDRLLAKGYDSRALAGLKIAVIGSETARALQAYGLMADFVPSVFNAGELASQLLAQTHFPLGKVLIARAREGSPELNDRLRAAQIDFLEIPVYDTIRLAQPGLEVDRFDYVTFTSASCVSSFVASVRDPDDLARVKAVCIGEQTAQRAAEYSMTVHVSRQATTASMVDLLCELADQSPAHRDPL
jgi:uroporphyrinogen III methyltransferase/synthase